MISVNVEGLSRVRALFESVLKRSVNPNTALEVIATKGWKDVIEHFRDESGPDGKWKALKHTRASGGNRILQDTGRLRLAQRWRTVGYDEAHIFTQIKYAAIHNFGGTVKTKSGKSFEMPQRKFLWISDKAKLSMIKTLLRWIAEGRVN